MTDDVAALAANDQFGAEMSEWINRGIVAASAIAAFRRTLAEDSMPAGVLNALTHKFADWYFATGVEDVE